ncbi:MAG: phytanoyl-CoA dioxygenase family protein [Chloroflexales bacterium]|nr:phytanoyl-CoA dioxygenase family protein [Chloroflexales bacterium]
MSDEAVATFDEVTDDVCAEDLYQTTIEAVSVDGFDAINEATIARYHSDGFLAIHNAFTPSEVQAAIDGLLDLIGGKVAGYRGIQYEAGAKNVLETIAPDQRQDYVRKLWKMCVAEPRLRAIAEHPKLVALLKRLIGEPSDLFQDQALLKPPLMGREKPWHQDNAYFNLPPETQVVGVWIALDEATPENGCMYLIPGSHREGPVVHFKRRDWQICDTDVATGRSVVAPLKPGGMLVFHGLLHHGTPPSRSPQRRRAVQLHYKPVSVQPILPEDRLAVFGSEGKDVTC